MDKFLALEETKKEQLTDPNKVAPGIMEEEQTPQDLSHSDLLRGRAKPVKVLTAVEEKDDKTLLGSMYKDKIFLRSLSLMASVLQVSL